MRRVLRQPLGQLQNDETVAELAAGKTFASKTAAVAISARIAVSLVSQPELDSCDNSPTYLLRSAIARLSERQPIRHGTGMKWCQPAHW